MSVLKYFGFQSEKQVVETLASIQPERVPSRLRGRLAKVRQKQGGFTLLELLVVVAIIAAIAGTSTILLRDTDRQAAAAAHVAMMDELMKGIETYKKLNEESFPSGFDSLMRNGSNTLVAATSIGAVGTDILNEDLATSLTATALTVPQAELLVAAGIKEVRVLSADTPTGAATGTSCAAADIKGLIRHKGNDVTASTIFRAINVANGCGYATNYELDDAIATQVMQTWNSAEARRVNADPAVVGVSQTLVALGIGPDTTLFDPSLRGAMTTVPVYRHVAADEYNRFIALFNVDEGVGEVRLQAIIDGAGDTKDEELGEWDNTRPT